MLERDWARLDGTGAMRFKSTPWLFALIAATAAMSNAHGAAPEIQPPRVVSTLSAPLPAPYDPSADAAADVANAINRAKASGRFVLLDFGGNWCPDCRMVAGTLALGEIRPALDRTFEVVMIDVGRMTRNLDIAATYHVRISAVPTIIVLDSQGRMVNAGNPSALSDARSMSPQAIVDTIFGWVKSAG